MDHFEIETSRRPGGTAIDDLAADVLVVAPPAADHPAPPRPPRHAVAARQHDPLTGLPDRSTFRQALLAAGSPAAGLCRLDIDEFTAINHMLGHDVSDKVLQVVARRLSDTLGPAYLIARTGGDEFSVLVPTSAPVTDLARVADLIQQAIRRPVQIGTRRLHLTASVGTAAPVAGHDSACDLMNAAESALTQAKASGREGRGRFDPDLHARQLIRHEMAWALPRALERGELFVEYQPMVRAHDGELYGVEALARWQHPQHGLVGPAQFIPVAEDTGMIDKVGRFVLRTACAQAGTWKTRHPGRELVMSVNIAPAQTDDPALAVLVAGLLAQHGIDPAMLQLEVTETRMMQVTGPALDTLRALARLGVRIAIDDFGTGYANLGNLRSLPIHHVKLARQFVSAPIGELADQVDCVLIAAVVGLARSLGLGVIAEGVESEAQAATLRRLGCDVIQGYLYGRPQSPAAIDARLGSGTDSPGAGRTKGIR
ncbi:putative bifunctional diguanylate cyclase/phosphodiesterase [Catellatospora methionotrophica]|uniref:putative bifunctional diguanylate cyclase/phosphodiesterase n=1 Tax=Catellatospora methionotrophica TaxID=121620 RepID=UPI0033D6D425